MPGPSDWINSVGFTLATLSFETTYLLLQLAGVQAAIVAHAEPFGLVHDQPMLVTRLKPLPDRLIVGEYGVVALE